MKTLLLTLGLLSSAVVLANDNPVQQMPVLSDAGNSVQQAAPAIPQPTSVNPAQQAIPVMTPAMRQALIAQARRLAAQQAVPASANQVHETNVRRLQRR